MTDPKLSDVEREAMERAWKAEDTPYTPKVAYEWAFLAGLRYQGGPSEAEVEAAARAMFQERIGPNWHQTSPEMRQVHLDDAHAALQAARNARGKASS